MENIIHTVTLANGHQVLLLEVPVSTNQSPESKLNVYCLSASGNQIWQIAAVPSRMADDVFVSLKIKDGRLFASRFFGSEFEINPVDGAATEIGWNK
jgi:YD repeat-containing protein